MRESLRLLCVCVVLYGCNALAQNPAQPSREPQAVAILEQAYAVSSDLPAADLHGSVVHARVRGRDESTSTAIVIKTRGRAIRTESPADTSLTTHGRSNHRDNSGVAWKDAPDPNAGHRHADHLPAYLLAEFLLRTDVALSYVGVEQIDGRPTHHVRAVPFVNFPEGTDPEFIRQHLANATTDLYIDADTLLLTQVTFTQVSVTDWRRGALVTIRYSDYRTLGGLKVPARQTRHFAGQLAWELTLDSVERNTGLPSSDFTGRQ